MYLEYGQDEEVNIRHLLLGVEGEEEEKGYEGEDGVAGGGDEVGGEMVVLLIIHEDAPGGRREE